MPQRFSTPTLLSMSSLSAGDSDRTESQGASEENFEAACCYVAANLEWQIDWMWLGQVPFGDTNKYVYKDDANHRTVSLQRRPVSCPSLKNTQISLTVKPSLACTILYAKKHKPSRAVSCRLIYSWEVGSSRILNHATGIVRAMVCWYAS
jgi:hypothetical protein